MKLGFRYDSKGDDGKPAVSVFNAETGEAVDRITAVTFTMRAGDFVPTLNIQCYPVKVEINGVEATEVTQADMDMFVARSRSIDLDGVGPNEQ